MLVGYRKYVSYLPDDQTPVVIFDTKGFLNTQPTVEASFLKWFIDKTSYFKIFLHQRSDLLDIVSTTEHDRVAAKTKNLRASSVLPSDSVRLGNTDGNTDGKDNEQKEKVRWDGLRPVQRELFDRLEACEAGTVVPFLGDHAYEYVPRWGVPGGIMIKDNRDPDAVWVVPHDPFLSASAVNASLPVWVSS